MDHMGRNQMDPNGEKLDGIILVVSWVMMGLKGKMANLVGRMSKTSASSWGKMTRERCTKCRPSSHLSNVPHPYE